MLSIYGYLRISLEILVIYFQKEKQTDTDCMTTHVVIHPTVTLCQKSRLAAYSANLIHTQN